MKPKKLIEIRIYATIRLKQNLVALTYEVTNRDLF